MPRRVALPEHIKLAGCGPFREHHSVTDESEDITNDAHGARGGDANGKRDWIRYPKVELRDEGPDSTQSKQSVAHVVGILCEEEVSDGPARRTSDVKPSRDTPTLKRKEEHFADKNLANDHDG